MSDIVERLVAEAEAIRLADGVDLFPREVDYHLLEDAVKVITDLRREALLRSEQLRDNIEADVKRMNSECSACEGSGIDESHDAALYYAHRGELSPCPVCDGTGENGLNP